MPALHLTPPLLVIPALLFASVLSAQNPFATQVVPFGHEAAEGSLMTISFGLAPEARYQFAEGGLRGHLTLMNRVSYRPEGRDVVFGVPLKSPGRSWSNVQLRLSNCDITKLTKTFATNSLSAPTLVFSAKVNWPDQANKSQTSPKPFESALSFPLTSIYASAGTKDLLLDYVFRGGTLKNNANWAKINAQPYALDAGVLGSILFGQAKVTWVGNRKCKDPGSFFGPTGLDALMVAYRKQAGLPALNNKFVLNMQSNSTAPLSSVLHAIGVTGDQKGLWVGACNRLHMTPVLIRSLFADGSGHARWSVSATYQSQLVNVPLWFQGAWTNSKTKGLELTNAVALRVPIQPPATQQRRALWAFSASATASASPPSNRAQDLPVIQYTGQ